MTTSRDSLLARPLRFSVLLLLAALVLGGLSGGCGDDNDGPSGPNLDLKRLTVIISLVRGIDILEGEAEVEGYGGSHRFDWERNASSGSTVVSVVADRLSTWRFDVEGRQIIDPDTTGYGLLYTQSREVDMLLIGDTLGVRLDFVVPRLEAITSPTTVRLTWSMDVPRATSFELRQIRPGHADSLFMVSASDTSIPRSAITDLRRYQVRGLLRDGRTSAFSVPIDVAP